MWHVNFSRLIEEGYHLDMIYSDLTLDLMAFWNFCDFLFNEIVQEDM